MNSDKPEANPFEVLAKPAQRVLSEHGVTSLELLAMYHEHDILQWHGIGQIIVRTIQIMLK